MSLVTLLLCIEVALVTEASRQIWGERERELPPAHGGTSVPEMAGLLGPAQKKLLSAEPSPSLESGGGGKTPLLSLFCLLDCHCVRVNEVSEFPVISNKTQGRGQLQHSACNIRI